MGRKEPEMMALNITDRETTEGKKRRTISYLRLSTEGQDLEKNKADILMFANSKDLGKVDFVEEKVSGKNVTEFMPGP